MKIERDGMISGPGPPSESQASLSVSKVTTSSGAALACYAALPWRGGRQARRGGAWDRITADSSCHCRSAPRTPSGDLSAAWRTV